MRWLSGLVGVVAVGWLISRPGRVSSAHIEAMSRGYAGLIQAALGGASEHEQHRTARAAALLTPGLTARDRAWVDHMWGLSEPEPTGETTAEGT